MKRQKEIRGLLAGIYSSDDGDLILDVFRDDEGIHIIQGDLALEFYSHWIIDEEGHVIDQIVDSMESTFD